MIALLPLDNRPCNLQFPAQIRRHRRRANRGAAPKIGSANSTSAATATRLRVWLDNLPVVAALIVSIDMLAYGGLVASRKTATDLETALARLQNDQRLAQIAPANCRFTRSIF